MKTDLQRILAFQIVRSFLCSRYCSYHHSNLIHASFAGHALLLKVAELVPKHPGRTGKGAAKAGASSSSGGGGGGGSGGGGGGGATKKSGKKKK